MLHELLYGLLTETLNLFPFSTHTACPLCGLQPCRRVSLRLLWSSKIHDKDTNGLHIYETILILLHYSIRDLNNIKDFSSQDGRVLMWDRRKPDKPATRLGKEHPLAS